MSDDASTVMRIGRYQLQNLQTSGVKFLFFDLRPESARKPHPLLQGSRAVKPENLLEEVRGAPPDSPIVLICETGESSARAAMELARQSYINVFVVEGGLSALD